MNVLRVNVGVIEENIVVDFFAYSYSFKDKVIKGKGSDDVIKL